MQVSSVVCSEFDLLFRFYPVWHHKSCLSSALSVQVPMIVVHVEDSEKVRMAAYTLDQMKAKTEPKSNSKLKSKSKSKSKSVIEPLTEPETELGTQTIPRVQGGSFSNFESGEQIDEQIGEQSW